MTTNRHYTFIAALAALIIVAIGLVVAADAVCRAIIEDVRTISLTSDSEISLEVLRTRVPQLRTEITRLQTELAAVNAKTLPSLDELQLSSSKQKLRIQQVERLGNATNSEGCRLVAVGTMGRLVAWLRHLDSTHVIQPQRLNLAASNEDGLRVALTLELPVRSE